MRWALSTTCLVGLAAAGCWSPHITSGSFACAPTDDPPCPSGFYCVDGLCLDHPAPPGGGNGGTAAADLSLPGDAADMSSPDLASPPDLAPPPDLTPPPPDLACFPFGHKCHHDKTCCAECCHGCNVFGSCAEIELERPGAVAAAPGAGQPTLQSGP